MSSEHSSGCGKVVSLHLHATEPGAEMLRVQEIELVEAKGILGDSRYFARLSRTSGAPTTRQVSLIEREQIAAHATSLGLELIQPGKVRSNVETAGIQLPGLPGTKLVIGTAVLLISGPRDPCAKMDAIHPGLKNLMENGKQGVLAQVVRSGKVRIGDPIRVLRD